MNVLERIWEDAIVILFEVISQPLYRMAEGNLENLNLNRRFLVLCLISGTPV
jgi:hypothetical protein